MDFMALINSCSKKGQGAVTILCLEMKIISTAALIKCLFLRNKALILRLARLRLTALPIFLLAMAANLK